MKASEPMFKIEPQSWHELISLCVDSNKSIEHYYDNIY